MRARWLFGLPVALAIAHALSFFGYLLDDAYISFRYARNLARGAGLVYNAGERVEGYSNLLWVLLTAAGERLGIPATLSVPLLGLAAVVAVVAITVQVGREIAADEPYAGLCAGAIVATSTGVAFYSVTGLETMLFGLCLLLATRELFRERPIAFAAAASLAVLTRPEGALFAALGGAYFIARSIRTPQLRQSSGWMSLVMLAVAAGYGAFKWSYFGALLPNTLLAKRPDLASGIVYGARHLVPVLGLVVVGIAATKRSPRASVLVSLWCVHWVAVVFEGGDWFPAGRLLAPYLPWLALAADIELAPRLVGPRRSLQHLACGAAVLLFFGFQVHDSLALSRSSAQTLALDYNRAQLARSLIARGSIAAHDIGLLGYVLTDTTIIDLGGLVDREIASGPGGYGEKHPSFDYLERRAPRIVLLASDAAVRDSSGALRAVPLFEVERYLEQSRWFRSHYVHEVSHALGPHYHVHVFARREAQPTVQAAGEPPRQDAARPAITLSGGR